MTDKEIYYFTGNCLSLDDHPEFGREIIEKSQADRIDWMRFVETGSNHLVLPTLFLKFRSHGILEFLPEEVSEHLGEIYELNRSRNKLILLQLAKITEVLNNHHIFPTFLKGGGNLLDGLYSDTGERILGDIDFLVPEYDYLPTAKLMESEGYSPVTAIPDYTDVKTSKHYPRMAHPDFPAVIEIHRLPVREKLQKELSTKIIDTEKQSVPALPGCFVLSDKHKIILNFIHSQAGNDESAYSIVSLRDLYDLYLMAKRQSLQEIIREFRKMRKAQNYFEYAKHALGLTDQFFKHDSLHYRIFLKRHDLFMDSTFFYRSYRMTYFLSQRLFSGYLGQFFRIFYSRKTQQSVIRKLGSRSWYTSHLLLYTRFFRKSR